MLQWPDVAEALGAALAEPWHGRVDVVAGPALGGIMIGHEVAAALGVRFVFAERAGGELTLRRGFAAGAGSVPWSSRTSSPPAGRPWRRRPCWRPFRRHGGWHRRDRRAHPEGTARPEGLRTLLVRLQAPAWDAG